MWWAIASVGEEEVFCFSETVSFRPLQFRGPHFCLVPQCKQQTKTQTHTHKYLILAVQRLCVDV